MLARTIGRINGFKGRIVRPRVQYLALRVRYLRYVGLSKRTIDYRALHNALPNSGPIPVRTTPSSAREVVQSFPNPARRSQGIEGAEGFAPDDAIFDERTELWERWSNAALAGAIASFGYANYGNPSILELGCGPAHLFYFLRLYGVSNYVGADGNPWFVEFNRSLRGYESQFLSLNLQEEIRLRVGTNPLSFDIVCAFELLEHIREDKIDNLICSIRNHMRPGSVAFLTSSLQTDMDVHVLVRNRDWWLKRFARWGLYPRADEDRLVRMIGRCHPFNWDPRISNVFAMEVRE